MEISKAIHINKLISDANMKLVKLQIKGIIDSELDICFYMDTFRKENLLVPYLTFRHNENLMPWNKVYMILKLYLPVSLSKNIYIQNNESI